MIFSIDSILFLQSAIPECSGVAGMVWLIIIAVSLNSGNFLSYCLTSFYVTMISEILFAIGFGLVIYLIVQRQIILRKSNRV